MLKTSSRPSREICTTVCIIDMERNLPYQWATLKTYADEDPFLERAIKWKPPIHFTLPEIRTLLRTNRKSIFKEYFSEIQVLGLSCYAWCMKYQLEVAKLVKSYNPNCLIVAGGPDLQYQSADIREKYSMLDILVKQDGEIPYRKILKMMAEGERNFEDIPGLVVISKDKVVDTGKGEVFQKFDKSPWLQNRKFFEDAIESIRQRGEPLRLVYETNRGCPYSCSYCNWGSSTSSKIRMFNLENIRLEIEWMKGLKLNDILLADGNFGILERDLEIAECFAQLGNTHPKPTVFYNPTKNKGLRVVQIAKILHKAGVCHSFPFGVQSTSKETLEAIGRANMRLSEQKIIREHLLNMPGMDTTAQLILGCPGETVESWKDSLTDMYEIGIDSLIILRFQVLPNSPADSIPYRKKWQMKTISRRCVDHWGKWGDNYGEYIQSCSSYSISDNVTMTLFASLIESAWKLKLINEAARYFLKTYNVSFRQFVRDLFDLFLLNSRFVFVSGTVGCLKSYFDSYLREASVEPYPYIQLDENGIRKNYPPSEFFDQRLAEQSKQFESELSEYLSERSSFYEANKVAVSTQVNFAPNTSLNYSSAFSIST